MKKHRGESANFFFENWQSQPYNSLTSRHYFLLLIVNQVQFAKKQVTNLMEVFKPSISFMKSEAVVQVVFLSSVTTRMIAYAKSH